MSTIGAMFAPDQDAVARQMLRVCRSNGRLGMANWTPDSAVGDMFRAVGKRVPPPSGLRPAVAWGTKDRVAELFGDGCTDLQTGSRTCAWRFPSAAARLEYFQTWYGPVIAAFSAVGEPGRPELEAELISVFQSHNTSGDQTLAMDVAYLEVVGIRI